MNQFNAWEKKGLNLESELHNYSKFRTSFFSGQIFESETIISLYYFMFLCINDQ